MNKKFHLAAQTLQQRSQAAFISPLRTISCKSLQQTDPQFRYAQSLKLPECQTHLLTLYYACKERHQLGQVLVSFPIGDGIFAKTPTFRSTITNTDLGHYENHCLPTRCLSMIILNSGFSMNLFMSQNLKLYPFSHKHFSNIFQRLWKKSKN